jgi:uncharacterized protein (DUF362 family)
MNRTLVGIARGEAHYRSSVVRELVKRSLSLAGDPLQSITPGMCICLKPNWIAGSREGAFDEWEQIITHPLVLRTVLELVAERLGAGRIVIADAPQTDSDIEVIWRRSGIRTLLDWVEKTYRNISVEVIDLRREYWLQRNNVTVSRRRLPGDPRGAVVVDLGENSEFVNHMSSGEYYGADYDFADTRQYHSGGHHRYLVSRSVLESDVFVNLPKLKTHKKAGMTLSLKNLVGINADKNYLPHHTLGSPSLGGDEYPDAGRKRRLETVLSKTFKRLIAGTGGRAPIWGPVARQVGTKVFGPSSQVIRSGNWYGNDTLWRMCLDLNKILLWYGGDGQRLAERRRYVSIIDGIIAGHGNGPVDADPYDLGLVVAGTDPVAVDMTCAQLVGFDWRKMPILRNALGVTRLPVSDIDLAKLVVRAEDGETLGIDALGAIAAFRPHFGWRGHIEAEKNSAPASR